MPSNSRALSVTATVPSSSDSRPASVLRLLRSARDSLRSCFLASDLAFLADLVGLVVVAAAFLFLLERFL